MFFCLRHGAVGAGDNEDSAVHLGSTGDHVFHVISVTGAVNVGVMAVFRFVFDSGGVNSDTTRAFFRCAAVKVVLPWSTWPMVPMLTWGFVRSNLPLAARTVRARRRWAAGAELEAGVWRKRFVEDLERKVEERSNLVEGFGRVKSEEEEEGDGEEEEKVAAAVAAAEMEAIG
ncbi:hypothetical protein HanRHA438_Chr16g0743661 [Helianthus annuus]|nr:hypothetical protein HanRHA438_Chr16g0743661 [Helianthus annuus]